MVLPMMEDQFERSFTGKSMSLRFDPYSEWLGVPEHLRPISHYEILGIQRFETSAEEIKKATARRMAKLQTLVSGPHGGAARKLMAQVEAARLCLLSETT